MLPLFSRAGNNLTLIFSLSICSKNLVMLISSWIVQKTGIRIQFDIETVLFGLLSDSDKIINLIIMLVKRCIFSYSRKNLPFTFNDITAYLQSYYSCEKKCLALKTFWRDGQNGNAFLIDYTNNLLDVKSIIKIHVQFMLYYPKLSECKYESCNCPHSCMSICV